MPPNTPEQGTFLNTAKWEPVMILGCHTKIKPQGRSRAGIQQHNIFTWLIVPGNLMCASNFTSQSTILDSTRHAYITPLLPNGCCS